MKIFGVTLSIIGFLRDHRSKSDSIRIKHISLINQNKIKFPKQQSICTE
jgi:hypothetical protein